MILAEALRSDVYQTKLELARALDWRDRFGKPDTRRVEKEVERARKTCSLPIMSGQLGYRLARNPEEYALDIDRRKKRALVQLVTVQSEHKLLERWRARLNPPEKPAVVQEAIQW
jgi:hypothetical protein